MLNTLQTISNTDIKYFSENSFNIIEKLDMLYFTIDVLTDDINVIKNNKNITIVDAIINNMYNNILNFANYIKTIKNNILDLYGECRIGFFYLPSNQYRIINYKNFNVNTFIYSNIFFYDKNKSNLIFDYTILKNKDFILLDKPIIKKDCFFDFSTIDFYNFDSLLFSELILDNTKTYSNLPISEIEGLIFETKKRKIQLIINDTTYNFDKTLTKIYRDMILKDFISWFYIKNIKDFINTKKSDIENFNKIFLEYINYTDIFYKYDISELDINGPHIGYTGDINYNYLDNTLQTIFKFNNKIKNMYKLLLNSFYHKLKYYENTNDILSLSKTEITKFNTIKIF